MSSPVVRSFWSIFHFLQLSGLEGGGRDASSTLGGRLACQGFERGMGLMSEYWGGVWASRHSSPTRNFEQSLHHRSTTPCPCVRLSWLTHANPLSWGAIVDPCFLSPTLILFLPGSWSSIGDYCGYGYDDILHSSRCHQESMQDASSLPVCMHSRSEQTPMDQAHSSQEVDHLSFRLLQLILLYRCKFKSWQVDWQVTCTSVQGGKLIGK